MARRILILFAHPAFESSIVNKRLVEVATGLNDVTIRDLYELYPALDVDIDAEQAALVEHDVVVMQHPFFWYSVPALLKQWMDLVLEHGWAYGSEGTALQGKWLMSAISTGAPEIAYQPSGTNHHSLRELLLPIELTANLCGMHYIPPFVVYGTHRLQLEDVEKHANRYRDALLFLRDGNLESIEADALHLPAPVAGTKAEQTDAR